MQLTKNKLFNSILAFLLLIDILVAFDLNQFYIRAILAFIFIITIPGLLIMLMLKIRNLGFWEYLVYTIGLSVAFIMFTGLAVNWILPWLNITNRPLSLWPILICFNIFLIAFWIIAYKRNFDLKFEIKFPKFSQLDRIFMIIPMFFPFMAVIGAFLLNNHGTNIVTMIMLGAIAVYVLLIVLFRNKLNENVYPWAILMISISILLASSLRSWYVSGVDTNLEYRIFQITKEKAFWSILNFRDVYNAMLSVTILPPILSLFTKINNQFILKLFFPLIFMFVPVLIYLTSKRYFKNIICFLASFFFMSQQFFMTWSTIPIRQEIAFLFFGLMLLILFTKEISSRTKTLLFVIFGFSMIVSHYSTSYIALAIFLLAYIFNFIYKIYENRKLKKGKLKSSERQKFYLTGILILLLTIFGFLWYNQITPAADGLIDFTKKSFSNLGSMFSEDVQAEGQSPIEQFSIFNKQKDYNTELKKYTKEIITTYSRTNLYDTAKYADYKANLKMSKGIAYKFNYNLVSIISSFRELLKIIIGKILIVVGVIHLLFMLKNNKINPEYSVVILSCFLILCLLVILPFTTISYDLVRVYQQILITLSIPVVFGILLIFKFIKEKKKFFGMALLLMIYFLFLSSFISQLTGGFDMSIRLNNLGGEYDLYSTHREETLSGQWIIKNYNNQKIYVDNHASNKIFLLITNTPRLTKDILPSIIDRNSYVCGGYTNMINGIVFKPFKGTPLSYNFPTKFLNANKNRIYNNGGSEIFK